MRWNKSEREQLINEFSTQHLTIDEIAKIHNRKNNTIIKKLTSLNLIVETDTMESKLQNHATNDLESEHETENDTMESKITNNTIIVSNSENDEPPTPIQNMRNIPQNSYCKWSLTEENQLINEFSNKRLSITEIAHIHKRGYAAIAMKLQKLNFGIDNIVKPLDYENLKLLITNHHMQHNVQSIKTYLSITVLQNDVEKIKNSINEQNLNIKKMNKNIKKLLDVMKEISKV